MTGLRSCSLWLLVGIACVSAATGLAEDVREPKLDVEHGSVSSE